MKVNELAIGDWVNFLIEVECDDTEYGQQTAVYEPSKVQQIRTWWLDAEVEGDYVNDIDQLQPIPLTTEILEKNGFKECTNGDWTNDNVDFILHKRKDGVFRIQNTNMTLPWVSCLQHALRLCGIDKGIEL